MVTLKILATVALFGLYAYYIWRMREFYIQAKIALGELDCPDLQAKIDIYRKYVNFRAPIFEAILSVCSILLLMFWVF